MSNDTRLSSGRLCNNLIRNIICSEIARKHDLEFIYGYADEIKELGVDLYESGTKFHDVLFYLREDQIEDILNRDEINFNLYASEEFYQGKYGANFVRNYVVNHKERIMDANKFKHRYKNNQDIFVHIRLDDVANSNPGFQYYDELINSLKTDQKVYITSDSLEHDICKRLIEKYDAICIDLSPIETIMFGSTCKHIILSMGTFSWTIGILGYFSNVFYPNFKDKPSFCPFELFDFPDWYPIEYVNESISS